MGDTNRRQITTSDNVSWQTEREKHLLTRIDALAFRVGYYEGILHVVAMREDVPDDVREEAQRAIGKKDAE